MRPIFIFLGVMISGCGYTILGRAPTGEDRFPAELTGSLPDLAITSITTEKRQVPGYTREHHPVNITVFVVTVRNIGSTWFDGAGEIRCADNPVDIKAKAYPVRGHRQNIILKPGDSTKLGARHTGWYPAGTRLRIFLHTDSNCFGCPPIREASYRNNYTDYTVP